jgi:hypothetical protein
VRRWIVFVIAATTFMAGCFFDTRDPEVPQSGETRWQEPSTPQTLIENLRVTLEDQQISFYMRGFRNDFRFHPDPQDSTEFAFQGRLVFDNWDRTVEDQFAQTIFGKADSIPLTFTNLDPPVFDQRGDSAYTRLRYELAIIDSLQGGGVDSAFYAGILTFIMKDEGEGWQLFRWIDSRGADPDIESWSKLRGDERI